MLSKKSPRDTLFISINMRSSRHYHCDAISETSILSSSDMIVSVEFCDLMSKIPPSGYFGDQ